METFLGGKVTIHLGDVREQLRLLPDDSFDCVVTSPPYWGLRDYSVDGQLGMEPSLGEHVEVMAEVFHEVKRVLKPTGTLWLNYGDSYAASPNGRSAADIKLLGTDDRTYRDKPFSTIGPINRGKLARWNRQSARNGHNLSADDDTVADVRIVPSGFLKPKDLCGIPWRVAFALQDDGWWLRQDIIWSKPNPMPESVTDRCTKAHEYIFMLTKAQRYYYDSDSIKEPAIYSGVTGMDESGFKNAANFDGKHAKTDIRGERQDRQRGHSRRHQGFNDRWDLMEKKQQCTGMRNKRSVWEVPTAPFAEAHFATFPPALIEPCIKAGCPEGGSVLDPFGGSGTTALVAASLGRTATLIELNPEYAKLARARIEAAFMGREEGSRHMVKQLGKTESPGPLFANLST